MMVNGGKQAASRLVLGLLQITSGNGQLLLVLLMVVVNLQPVMVNSGS